MLARAERDGSALRALDDGPTLEADLGYICEEGVGSPGTELEFAL